jgi:hypothetical protein
MSVFKKKNEMLNDEKFKFIYSYYFNSGLTVRYFCSNQRMNEAKFFYWQHKMKVELSLKRGGFVSVVFGTDKHVY